MEPPYDELEGVKSTISGYISGVKKNPTYEEVGAGAQFCDAGSQYRSAIFCHDGAQKTLAETSRKRVQSRFKQPIVTEIIRATAFYPAEDYHQVYYKKNPIRSKLYRYGCGRDRRLCELWGDKKS